MKTLWSCEEKTKRAFNFRHFFPATCQKQWRGSSFWLQQRVQKLTAVKGQGTDYTRPFFLFFTRSEARARSLATLCNDAAAAVLLLRSRSFVWLCHSSLRRLFFSSEWLNVYARSCCSDCSATLCAFFTRNLSCFGPVFSLLLLFQTQMFVWTLQLLHVVLPPVYHTHTQGEFRLIVSLHVLLGFVPLPHLAQSPAGGVVSDIFIVRSLNILRWVLSREIDILIRRGLRRLWVSLASWKISRSCL
jgi:hypothetical protein